jgi:hypothetical protein
LCFALRARCDPSINRFFKRHQPFIHSLTQPTNQPINQPTNQSINQSINPCIHPCRLEAGGMSPHNMSEHLRCHVYVCTHRRWRACGC